MTARILVMDDEPNWAAYATEKLDRTFEVELAFDLKTTMAKLKKKSYDLIIVSSTQLEVLKAIREKYPHQRVIVATSQPTAREAVNAYRLGALDYLTKDFRPEIISAKITEALQKTHKIPA